MHKPFSEYFSHFWCGRCWHFTVKFPLPQQRSWCGPVAFSLMVLHWWCNFMINHYNVCVKNGQTCASAGWFCQAGYFLIKWLLSSNTVLIWHVCASDLCNFRLFCLGRVPQGRGTPQGSRLGPIQFVFSQRSRSDGQQALQLSAIFCRWCRDAWLIQGIWFPRWAVARRTLGFATWYSLWKENVIFINVILQVFLVGTIPFNECY